MVKTTIKAVDFQPVGHVMAYKIVYLLCTINKANGELKALYLASCISGGHEPIWGVWTIEGRFKRFFSRKSQIEKAYSHLAWRRKYGEWNLFNAVDEIDRTKLKKTYKPIPSTSKTERLKLVHSR